MKSKYIGVLHEALDAKRGGICPNKPINTAFLLADSFNFSYGPNAHAIETIRKV